MKNHLTNHQNGRFIKHNDPIRKHLQVNEFNLLDVCDIPLAFPDNPLANVFHHKLHSEQELQTSVHMMPDIDQVFEKERPPVIRPIDFTEDWKRMRRRQASRENRDDDDDLEIDLQTLMSSYKEKPKNVPNVANTEAAQPSFSKPPTDSVIVAEEPPIHEGLDEAESHFDEAPPIPQRQTERAQQTQSQSPSFERESPLEDDKFVPYFPENDVLRAPAVVPEEELEAIREAAREAGFQEGYEQGIDQGAREHEGKLQKIVEELDKVMMEMQGLQKTIMHKSQENFQAICQSLMEALLDKEFQLHPESFQKIVERAISDALPDDDYKVVLHPSVIKDLMKSPSSTLAQKIKADDKLETYQFRIESKQGVLDARVKDIIQNLLEQADLQLFEVAENDGKAS